MRPTHGEGQPQQANQTGCVVLPRPSPWPPLPAWLDSPVSSQRPTVAARMGEEHLG